MFPPVSLYAHKRVMALFDVDAQEMVGREVLVTFETAMGVECMVVELKVAMRAKGNGGLVRRK